MTTQTEAERLAELLERIDGQHWQVQDSAAAELRRLVSFNQQLMDEVARLKHQIELRKLAVESLNEGLRLDDWPKIGCVNHDCDQCKAAQEPVAWQFFQGGKWHNGMAFNDHRKHTEAAGVPVRDLYPSPPAQRTWVGLTDEEIRSIFQQMFDAKADWPAFAKALEAKLKEKNT